jgi:hypothetical protein
VKPKTVEVCGVEGRGRTITAARDDALKGIEHFLKSAESPPDLFRWGDLLALVWVGLYGTKTRWTYKLLRISELLQNTDMTGRVRIYACCSGFDTYTAALHAMRSHAAQTLFDPKSDIDDPHDIVGDDDKLKAEFASWARSQRRYHRIATENPARTDAEIRDQMRKEGL